MGAMVYGSIFALLIVAVGMFYFIRAFSTANKLDNKHRIGVIIIIFALLVLFISSISGVIERKRMNNYLNQQDVYEQVNDSLYKKVGEK